MKTVAVVPEMCECGRLYKDRRDRDGKMMCSACHSGLSVDDLKALWGTPVPDSCFGKEVIIKENVTCKFGKKFEDYTLQEHMKFLGFSTEEEK